MDVLAEQVDFDVEAIAGAHATQRRHRERVRDERHAEASVRERGDGEAHAVERDRALLDDERRQLGGQRADELAVIADGLDGDDFDGAVDVPLYPVAAQRVARA